MASYNNALLCQVQIQIICAVEEAWPIFKLNKCQSRFVINTKIRWFIQIRVKLQILIIKQRESHKTLLKMIVNKDALSHNITLITINSLLQHYQKTITLLLCPQEKQELLDQRHSVGIIF
jgi:hypothetical protein